MCVAEVVFEGTGAAILGGLIAAGVGVWGVRWQINAGRKAEARREDVRVALSIQARALAMNLALVEYVSRPIRRRDEVDRASIELWTAIADAACRRPNDVAFRTWVGEFQGAVVTALDDFTVRRGRREYDALAEWLNTGAQALGSHLESAEPLPPMTMPPYFGKKTGRG